MGRESRGVIIVSLDAGTDFEETKRRVSEIGGVLGVDYNHLTRKLLVRYREDGEGARNVESKVRKVLDAGRGREPKQRRHIHDKKRR